MPREDQIGEMGAGPRQSRNMEGTAENRVGWAADTSKSAAKSAAEAAALKRFGNKYGRSV